MDFLRTEYLEQLILKGNKSLRETFNLSKKHYSPFQIVNAYIIEELLLKEKTNLLVSLPKANNVEELFYPLILFPVLRCFLKNIETNATISIDDLIIETQSGEISHVKTITENQLSILKIGTTKRTDLSTKSSILILSPTIKNKIAEIKRRDTQLKREKGIGNLKIKLQDDIQKYQEIFCQFNNTTQALPVNNKTKIVVIAPKIDFLTTIPGFIPYEYINKSGVITVHTSFEPLLYVVNDFKTAQDFIIEKGLEIDTIIFLGHNKYKSTSSVSKLYRQGKFNRCIFIGTDDIESSDKFKVLKWNWTLSEIKYFSKVPNYKINAVNVPHPELSKEILNYARIIENVEAINENLVNLKPLLKFIRKIYPLTAFNNEQRIKASGNIILEQFQKDAEEFFQDEYASIDRESENDFHMLKKCFEGIIALIKKSNLKANWFKESPEIFDYIVVPNMQKNEWEKEIKNYVPNRPIGARVKNLADLNNILQAKVNQNNFIGLKTANVITLKEFENKPADNKSYLFISLYGYNVYPDTLIEKIYAKNVTSNLLLYDEEQKAFQYYLHRFYQNSLQEFQSADREELCNLKYSKVPDISSLNIDDWIKHLIEFDNLKFSKSDDFRYEIIFEEENKVVKERESKNVYVEDAEEYYKEVCQLTKGDKVRIYQNPDKDVLHDIVKMTDEQDLFRRVDILSSLWKTALRDYYQIMGSQYSNRKKRNDKYKIIFTNGDDPITGLEIEEVIDYRIEHDLEFKTGDFKIIDENYNIDSLHEELKKNGLTVEKNRLENWLKVDNKTKFPKRKIDMLAIIKVVNHPDLNSQIKQILPLMKEYAGKLNQAGLKFSEEINNYIITKEKGTMLHWLSENHIEKIISDGAPLRTIKSIKKIDYEISN